MRKVCIVTICGGSNFGNRLQNFALQNILENINCEPETLLNLAGEVGGTFYRYNFFRMIFRSRFVELIARKVIRNARILKKIRFAQYNNTYIKWSKFVSYKKRVSDYINDYYDFFIAGSDQIWNPDIQFNSEIEYLSFATDEKKISYAASFGVSSITDEQIPAIKKQLDTFRNISVREKAGIDILNQLDISNGKVVLDPTMLMTAEQWCMYEMKPKFHVEHGKYILSYVIWGKQSEDMEYIKIIAKKNGWEIIDICDQNNLDYYSITPAEFIYLIHYSGFVFTDSFHASVFSTLFHKDYAVKNRKGMSSRIATLTQTLGLEKTLAWNIENTDYHLDYSFVDEKLAIERKDSLLYLKEALGILV